ncbi:hypothetical protein MLAC_20620 [Mycobacterium lacus]|uniref:Transposase IS4-like domain-containing protein n=1 Tax=Mycobacterium lacus TaxID=169765 RepID=A0A7I7NK55_9MYCO|nr:hypothetical protein MLAC_20620 [Mycobacterium lacus]
MGRRGGKWHTGFVRSHQRQRPDESTLRKLFARLDADALDQALGVWMWTRTFTVEQRRVIAIDGKTIRGARTRAGGKAPHLIAAFDHGAGVVLGQVAVDAKSNEIPAARTLLRHLDLDDAVVTLDAMHTKPIPPHSSPAQAATTCSQ